MLKKTITFEDFEGEERTEDFYFNLTRAEVLQWELGETGGLSARLKRLVAAKDVPELTEYFKEIITKSYGEKSADGRRFIKTRPITEAFTQTEAYSNLFMELATNTDAASAFINGITPKDPGDHLAKDVDANKAALAAALERTQQS